MSAAEGLEVSGATVRIGTATLVDDAGFTVPHGAMCAIAGLNGAGKTTLLHFILGLHPQARGEVRFASADLRAMARPERARRVAFVEHAAQTELPHTVRDVVALGRIPHHGWGRHPGADDATICDRALAMVGLLALADRPWRGLSGGEQQRVQIARALAQEPALLLLDEPTSHLDLRAQLATLAMLRRQAALGLTVLVAIHDLALAAAYFDLVLMMRRGRVVAFGPIATTLTADLIRDVYDVSVELVRDPRTGRVLIAPGLDTVAF